MKQPSPFPTAATVANAAAAAAADSLAAGASAGEVAAASAAAAGADDPMPQPPVEPQLEDCCGSGCVVCVFDAYETARERYLVRLAAWQARHPSAAQPAP